VEGLPKGCPYMSGSIHPHWESYADHYQAKPNPNTNHIDTVDAG